MQPNQPFGHYAPPQQHQAANPYANPYAPPAPQSPAMYRQNVFVPHGAVAGPLVGPTLRKVKLALGIAQVLAMIVGFVLLGIGIAMQDETGSVLAMAGGGVLALWYLLLFGYAITNMIWLYQFWSWIPPEQRYTSMWKKYISPGTAIGFMFIPYFNIYWMFVVYLGLADIMERMRVQFPSSKGPVKTLAILTIVIPMVFFPAGPFLQYMLAKHLEEMAKEMSSRMMGGYAPA
jgi:hypothetical protein